MAVQIRSRMAIVPGEGSVEWTDGERHAVLTVGAISTGDVQVSLVSGMTSTVFTLPREIAEFFHADLGDAVSRAPTPEAAQRGHEFLSALAGTPDGDMLADALDRAHRNRVLGGAA